MTPRWCTIAHKPPHSHGDCVRACIATVLDVQTEAVPHFAHDGADPYTVLARARDWLAKGGETVWVTMYPPVERAELLEMLGEHNPDSTYMLFGMTDSGTGHVVVCQGGRIVHNPAWHGGSLVRSGPGGWVVWIVGRV